MNKGIVNGLMQKKVLVLSRTITAAKMYSYISQQSFPTVLKH